MGKTTITKKGIRLLVKLAASGRALSFTRVAVGTGNLPDGISPEDMDRLNIYKMDGVLASCSASENTAAIIFQISSINVEHDFIVTEAGLFANDPDLGEILYTYLDMSEDPQYVYSQGSSISKFLEITLNVVIGTEVNVTAVINPGSLVKRDDFDAAEARIDNLETPEFDDAGEDISDYKAALDLIKSNTAISGLLTAIKSALKFSGEMVENLKAKKMDTAGGDISNTKIVDMDNIESEFPVPAPGDTGKGFAGKVRKFILDFNLYKEGIITLGKLVNNGQTTEAGFALDARMGKTLYDLYLEQSSDLTIRYNAETDTVEVFYNDAWCSIRDNAAQGVALFDRGNQYTLITGGWTISVKAGSVGATIGATLNLSATGTTVVAEGHIHTKKTIDMTQYRSIKIKYTDLSITNSWSGVGFGIATQDSLTGVKETYIRYGANSSGECIIDISDIVGNYRVYLYACGNALGTASVAVSCVTLCSI